MAVNRLPSPGSKVSAATVTTKGDLIAGTGNTEVTRLAAGSNGTTLVADSAQTTGLKWALGNPLSLNAQTGTTYTFVLADAYKLVTASNGSSQTYTIPPSSSVNFELGTTINVVQLGSGQVSLSQGVGVTILSTAVTSSAPKIRAQYALATCIKVASDSWVVVGDIA